MKILMKKALAAKVLAVAVEGDIHDWAAYIDAVPGKKHDDEAQLVAEEGVKLDRDVAAVLFPCLDMKKWRK